MTRVVEGLGRSWVWPDSDQECIKVIFDWLGDMARATRLCRMRRTAIQAGGNMGVWPWELSKVFKRVVTCEPDPECFALLRENLQGTDNVEMHQVALLDAPGYCRLQGEPTNRGAQYVARQRAAAHESENAVWAVTIDSLAVIDCDLIYLDIEGAELSALKGARETIRRTLPVIAIEDKNLSTRFGTSKYDAEKWLAHEFGYTVAARPHNDVVLICDTES